MLKIKRLAQVPGAEGFHNRTRDLIDSVTSKPQNDLGNPEAFHNKSRDLIDSITPQDATGDQGQGGGQMIYVVVKEWYGGGAIDAVEIVSAWNNEQAAYEEIDKLRTGPWENVNYDVQEVMLKG